MKNFSLHTKTIEDTTLKILKEISNNNKFNDFYLVGGTALSLILGHRHSIDLDFFSQKEFKHSLVNSLKSSIEPIVVSDNSIEVYYNNVKLFFFYFAYPRLKDTMLIDGVRFADPIDIGIMKLLALQGRTTRKDIIDLYFIDKEIIVLEELLDLFESNFPKESFNSYQNIKQLIDEEELSKQPMPVMIRDSDNWDEMLNHVKSKLIAYIRRKIFDKFN